MRRRTAQLNAISRSYTAKRQREALETLKLCYNIQDWEHFQRLTTYKSSPAALVNALANKKPWALKLVDVYQEFYGGKECYAYSLDAMPVIRCKDCIYFTEYCRIVDGVASDHVCSRKHELDGTMHRAKACDYCSWAERKENEKL